MKIVRFARFFSMFFCMMCVLSCQKDENPTPKEPELPKEYYIEYTAYSAGIYRFVTGISYATPEGIVHEDVSWGCSSTSCVVGPVAKGFQCSMSAGGNGTCTVYISVCRGSEPFVLKASGKTSASYIIDF